MLNFLKQTRKFINSKDLVCIIIGNESCDLDSAVCAISLAYFFQQPTNQLKSGSKAQQFLPILNIPREDYQLKTEVKYVFNEHGIMQHDLSFRDDLDANFLSSCDFILVDHHVSGFAAQCVQIFDHRPRDSSSHFPENCQLHLETVGSCATLIAEQYLKSNSRNDNSAMVLNMLRKTIILDTVNFSAAAARSTPKDLSVCKQLEQILAAEEASRQEIYNSLVNARRDISALTCQQLLRKDMKILSNIKSDVIIALPGIPLLVCEFICKEGAVAAIKAFAEQQNCSVILILGLKDMLDGSIQRDLALIDINNAELWLKIHNALLQNVDLNLKPHSWQCKEFERACLYQQQNIKMTRKHILPLIKNIIDI